MSRRKSRRPWVVLAIALVGSVAATLAPSRAPAAVAATPDLTITADTRYVVDPAKARIHVTAALTVVNHLKDTKTRQFYFDRAYLAVQPGTTRFRIKSATGDPSVSVAQKKKDHTLLRIDFGKRLNAGRTRTMTLTFDIVDKGGSPTRDVRIGSSLVSFAAWAFASSSTPGGTVTVVWPAGFNIEVDANELGEPKKDSSGTITYTTGRLAKPLDFFAYFLADRPNAYTETLLPVEVGGRTLDIALRSWPDDPAWAKQVGGVLAKGLPVLSDSIGLPWLDPGQLVVAEAISRSTGGYSGRYDPEVGRIEVAYYASPRVVLHEAAHAWFDGRLLAERWANEGFASFYGDQAAAALKFKVARPSLTSRQAANRVPLNGWGPAPGTDVAVDEYGYVASAEVARAIAERAGPAGLASVWQAARNGVAAYQPPGLGESNGAAGSGSDVGAVESGAAPPDWRGLLDLLEDRTGRTYGDIWRTWVIRPEEASLLDERLAARRLYDDVVRRAGEWQLPPVIRQAMRAWQFEQATALLTAADHLLDDRAAVEAAAETAQLELPRAMRAAFEGQASFAAAAAEADAELQTIAAYRAAAAVQPAAPDIVLEVGLWGATPDADLAQAAAAFSSGDLRASVEASARAQVAWAGAAELGRNRLMTILGATIASLIAVGFIVGRFRSMRRRLARRAEARAYARSVRTLATREAVRSRAMAHPIDQDPRPRGRR
jgi:hypothetical protein